MKGSQEIMIRSMRRTAATAVLAVVTAGSLMTSMPAQAAQANVELEVCHTGAPDLDVKLRGFNQDNVKSPWTPVVEIPPYSCHWFTGWWWETNRTVEIDWMIPYSPGWSIYLAFIPGHTPDGTWQEATINV
jgi:hypothetical protein